MCPLHRITLITVLAHFSCGVAAASTAESAVRLAAVVSVALAQSDAAAGPKSDEPDAIYPNDQLARFEIWIGLWSVTERHFNAHGDVVATVNGSEEIAWLLDRHAIKRDYRSGDKSSKFRAMGIWTFNDVNDVYQGVWFDNAGTAGPTLVEGKWEPATLTMVATTESSRKDGSPVRHRVVERFVDPDHREATTYLVEGTELTKRIHVEYVRTVPCPSRIRTIFDDALGRRKP